MPSVTARPELDRDQIAAVRRLADDLAARYKAPPLNDQALSRLADRDRALRHLLAYDDQQVLRGYAQLTLGAETADAELAVRPDHLDRMLSTIERLAGHRAVRAWAHGQHSPVGPALAARGYLVRRLLWQLRRPLTDLPSAALPDGVTIRPFVPGRDEQAWLAVNAAAFAGHAEQGGWTVRDVQIREAEAWFDPAGFLLAWRAEDLLGYHWTKVHTQQLGEVYVLGVAPQAQGLRLGSGLLAAGLAHLVARGCAQVLLYVDDDNGGALRLYERAGFERYDSDTQYLGNPG